MSAPTSNNTVPKEEAPPPMAPPGEQQLVGKEPSTQEINIQNADPKPLLENKSISKEKENTVTETSPEIVKNETKSAETEEKSMEVTKSEVLPNKEATVEIKLKEEEKSDINKNKEEKSEVKAKEELNPVEETRIEEGKANSEQKIDEQLSKIGDRPEEKKDDKLSEIVNAKSSEGNTGLNAGTNISEGDITKEKQNGAQDISQQEDASEKKCLKPEEEKPATSETKHTSEPQTQNKQESQPSDIKTTRDTEEKEENDAPQEECIDIEELSEQVMNIINEGIATDDANKDDLQKRNLDLQHFIVKLIHLLKEKTDLSINLERQNSALISQAKSLKDVISITKDLLGIRNMEVEHLQADLDSMQEAIKAERNRHNTAVQHLTEAMGLNDKLKAEYLTQMDLFEKLKEKYTEKVVILTRENIRLTKLMQEHGLDTSAAVEPPETVQTTPDPNQPESVDK